MLRQLNSVGCMKRRRMNVQLLCVTLPSSRVTESVKQISMHNEDSVIDLLPLDSIKVTQNNKHLIKL